jgi:hypothetical protein
MNTVGSLSNLDQTAGLLAQRLQAWKHAVAYLEEYFEAVEKIHKAQAKEYEKVLKVPFSPSLPLLASS